MKQIFFEELQKYSEDRIPSWFKKNQNDIDVVESLSVFDNAKGSFFEKNPSLLRTLFLLFSVFIIFLIYVSKAFTLQIIHSREYQALANANRIRSFSIQAERGVIYDRSGEVLVRNKPAFSLVMDTTGCSLESSMILCKNIAKSVSKFVEITDIDRVFREIDSRKLNVVLADGLSKNDVVLIETKLSSIPSVTIVTAPMRDYLHGEIFAHLIGYVGFGDTLYPSIEGKTGVEDYYDNVLAGVWGRKVVQTNSFGTSFEDVTLQEPTPGKSIVLYTDLDLQKKAYEVLKNAIENSEEEVTAGAIVVQDPKTGGILALVSYPSFDPNKFSSGISSAELGELNRDPSYPFFNRVISASYPPGSTFKMVVASAVLEEGIVGPYYNVFDPGYIQVGSYTYKNWKLDGHGDVDLRKAIQVSNDVYFYVVGGGYEGVKGLGIGRLADWATKFGFGSVTGIDMTGEVSGFMPDGTHKDWYLGDTYITSIGQGDVLATPLQVNNMMSYFANGGYLLKPQVVKEVEGSEQRDIEVISQNLTSSYVYEAVREGLKLAVEPGGTAYPFFDFPQKNNGIEVAGKTGTAEYIDVNGEEKTHAWFTVFGPYNNPEIVLTVFLEGGGSGSSDAAPIARELLDFWFSK